MCLKILKKKKNQNMHFQRQSKSNPFEHIRGRVLLKFILEHICFKEYVKNRELELNEDNVFITSTTGLTSGKSTKNLQG